MPDLHGWITQQISKTQQQAERWHDLECAAHHTTLIDATVLQGATLCDCGGPATVLRRCEADLRICNRHHLDPHAIWHEAAMCEGCGTEGEMAYPRTENLNDCPELLDLAYAYGLTGEILTNLDRPQKGERPEPGPGFRMPDVITESITSLYTQMLAAVDATVTRTLIDGDSTGAPLGFRIVDPPAEPTAMDRALALLDPHLRACPLYKAGPPVLYPNWHGPA